MPALEMGVYAHALRWTLRDDLLVFRRIRVIDLGKKALENEVTSLLAAGILLAEMAAHATDAADLAHKRALVGIVAENMHRGGRGDKLDQLFRTYGHALAATDAEALVDLGKPVGNRNRILGADVGARP